jgi:hypothetical protein
MLFYNLCRSQIRNPGTAHSGKFCAYDVQALLKVEFKGKYAIGKQVYLLWSNFKNRTVQPWSLRHSLNI